MYNLGMDLSGSTACPTLFGTEEQKNIPRCKNMSQKTSCRVYPVGDKLSVQKLFSLKEGLTRVLSDSDTLTSAT